MDVLKFIKENRLVSISRQVYGDDLLKSAEAIVDSGIKLLEITFDQADENCLKLTGDSISLVKKTLGDKICVGAGTVMTLEQARAAKDAGADFALAPNVDFEVIHEMKRLGLIAVPGAFTPSEIAAAYKEGADIVKVFPADSLGVNYIKAVRGPINHIPLMAVGGVSAQNVKSFLDCGCTSAGIGSNIINKKRAKAGQFDEIRQAALELYNAIHQEMIMSAKNFVVMDWGSTNVRAFLFIDDKQVDTKKSPEGVTVVRGQACEGVFDRLTADWFAKYGPMPTIMAGMVGSINGWADAQYLQCPVNLDELPNHLTEVKHSKGYKIRIVPGLCVKDPDNYNVIRGEETQLVGAIKKQSSKVYLMPGTHCKWVLADGAKINSFRTAMTGEMHSIMMKYSLVGLGAGEQEESMSDFEAGLERGYNENNIVPRLFEIRGANILGAIKPSHVGEF